jgi:hypothetical protein
MIEIETFSYCLGSFAFGVFVALLVLGKMIEDERRVR